MSKPASTTASSTRFSIARYATNNSSPIPVSSGMPNSLTFCQAHWAKLVRESYQLRESAMNRDESWRVIAWQRRGLADLLDELSEAEWETPSLCAGWRVRDVAAHVPWRHRRQASGR